MKGRYLLRIGEQIRRSLATHIAQSVRDPNVGPVTINAVEVSKDLWVARVFVDPAGDNDEKDATMAGLRRAEPFLRSLLGRELDASRVPELRFVVDPSASAARRIEEILAEVLPPGEDCSGAS